MKVINADGSVPEMCGNGLRCVALELARGRHIARGELVFDTDAGPRACTIEDTKGEGMIRVDMGIVSSHGPCTIDVTGEVVEAWIADAGNPHAIVFGDATRGRAEALGPRIERDPRFPRGTNVECARVEGGGIDLIVWERGVGITLACGTGACATAAVACARGMLMVGQPIPVRLPGGELEVTIEANGRAWMRGPARHVFSGELTATTRPRASA
jgi:diaminopimelate epimerase